MTIEQLTRFLTVAEYMNFTKAADMLFISLSTLSKSISDLENSLGIELFIRTKRKIVLTEGGRALVKEGSRILTDFTRLENTIRQTYSRPPHMLHVCARGRVSEKILKLLEYYVERFPADSISIVNCEYGEVSKFLNKGEADIGLVMESELCGEEENLEMRSIEKGRMVAIVSPHHKLADRTSIKLEELKKERVFLCKPRSMERYENKADIAKYLETFSFCENVPTDDTLVFMVRANQGIGVLPEPIARNYFSDMVLLNLEEAGEPSDIVLTWRRDNTNPALRHFMQGLSEYEGDLQTEE